MSNKNRKILLLYPNGSIVILNNKMIVQIKNIKNKNLTSKRNLQTIKNKEIKLINQVIINHTQKFDLKATTKTMMKKFI